MGNHCLILQWLHGVPRARRTHSTEQLRWIKSSWGATRCDAGLALMSSVGFTPDDVSRAAGASITSPQCDMPGAILLPRREACPQLLCSGWHADVPMLHVDAPMGAQLKRVALLFASTVPSLRVLVASDLSIPGANFNDASRAHEPSFMLAARWGKLLGFSVEPIMA